MSNQIAVPKSAIIAPIQIKGKHSVFHAERHGEKLNANMGDCGIDLFPCDILKVEDIKSKGSSILSKLSMGLGWHIIYVSTGVSMTITAGAYLFVTARSSTARLVPSAIALSGIIDGGYTGEILIRFSCPNATLEETKLFIQAAIAEKKALAQAIPQMFCYPQFMVVTEGDIIVPPGMGRGANGFGSTDKPA